MIKIVVTGAAGRMGRRIVANALNDSAVKLVGAIEKSSSPFLGSDAGVLAGCGGFGVRVTDDLKKVLEAADVVVDFSHADATLSHLQVVSGLKKAVVIGTTGHTADQERYIKQVSEIVPIVMAPNMSVMVNVLWKVLSVAARAIGSGAKVKVSETHHVEKKDKPSGTALEIVKILQDSGVSVADVQCHREGDVVGDHKVVFDHEFESLEILHHAKQRDTFAIGAIRAAKWVVGRSPGLYSMTDVLGLS